MFFGGMDDIMSAMLGGGMGGAGRSARRKGRSIGIEYPVTLEDLYNGKSVEVPHSRSVLCSKCNGSGSTKPGVDTKCIGCHGKGIKVMTSQRGNMIQQMQVSCEECRGTGFKVDPKFMCKKCNGTRIETTTVPLSLVIERGMASNAQIPFKEEGDVSPDIDVPGDVIIILKQGKHERFERKEDDLVLKQSISLGEAICGFQLVIHHLDDRRLVVKNEPGRVIKPGDKRVISGEGMPLRNKPGQFGDLIVEFTVVFPERLETSQIEDLQSVLPGENTRAGNESEKHVVYLNRQPLEQVKKEIDAEDDDDEDARGSGLPCAAQ